MTEAVDRKVRQDVSDVLVRYATGIDRRDWELFRTCFTDDCVADYGEIGLWHGVDEITDWMTVVHEACGHTLHRITNIAVSPAPDGVTARSYVEALVLGPDNGAGVRGADGFYDDELVETTDGWRITRRRFTLIRQEAVAGS